MENKKTSKKFLAATLLMSLALSMAPVFGNNTATAGTQDFVCGETLVDTRNGKTYNTVQIGSQCWMAENLNVGVMVDGKSNQSASCSAIQKYCYNNDESKCDEYGAYYQWSQAMCGSREESTQGICPAGWHLPSDSEYKTLEMELGMSQTEADKGNVWRGTDQGNQLKVTGTSGFDALMAGGRGYYGNFGQLGGKATFWTSTKYNNSSKAAFYRMLLVGGPKIRRWSYDNQNAFSVRCVQNESITPLPSDTTAPEISIARPTSGRPFISELLANASDPNVVGQLTSGIKEVQFYIDGNAYGAPVTTANPNYMVSISTPLLYGQHTIGAEAIDNAGNKSQIAEVLAFYIGTGGDGYSLSGYVYFNETQNPVSGAIVTIKPQVYGYGTKDYTIITDNNGHYQIDNIMATTQSSSGAMSWVTYTPYVTKSEFDNFTGQSFIFDQTNSISINFELKNNTPPPVQTDNLISNPSIEDNAFGWNTGSWGTNNASFQYTVIQYIIEGRTGNGAQATITSYTDGDAKWYFNDVAITGGLQYTFSNYYKSTTNSTVTMRYTLQDGTFMYVDLGYLSASAEWVQFTKDIIAPANAVSLTVFHLINSIGTLTVDDYSLTEKQITPQPTFAEGMVSFDFDDGWLSTYQNALPILNNAGIKSTQYIFTDALNTAGYISTEQMLLMQSQGHEIGGHSKSHSSLLALTQQQLSEEVLNSKNALEAMGVNAINSFAYPYGEWNNTAKAFVQQSGYKSARTAMSIDGGFNYKNQDPYILKTMSVESNTPVSTIKQWIDQAKTNKTWLILVYHQVENNGGQYSTTPENLTEVTDYVVSTNIKTVTASEGVNMIAQ